MAGTWQQVLDELGDTFGGMLPERPGRGRVGRACSATRTTRTSTTADGQFRHPWDYPTNPTSRRRPTTIGPAATNDGPILAVRGAPAPTPRIRDGLECRGLPGRRRHRRRAGHARQAHGRRGELLQVRDLARHPQPARRTADLHTNVRPRHGPAGRLEPRRRPRLRLPLLGLEPHRPMTASHPDPNAHAFNAPCTWPPQAADAGGDAEPDPVPTDIRAARALDRAGPEDPGCHPGAAPEGQRTTRAARTCDEPSCRAASDRMPPPVRCACRCHGEAVVHVSLVCDCGKPVVPCADPTDDVSVRRRPSRSRASSTCPSSRPFNTPHRADALLGGSGPAAARAHPARSPGSAASSTSSSARARGSARARTSSCRICSSARHPATVASAPTTRSSGSHPTCSSLPDQEADERAA